jgi:hypothetical protein
MEIVNARIVLIANKFPMVVLWGPLGGSDSDIFLECLNIRYAGFSAWITAIKRPM